MSLNDLVSIDNKFLRNSSFEIVSPGNSGTSKAFFPSELMQGGGVLTKNELYAISDRSPKDSQAT